MLVVGLVVFGNFVLLFCIGLGIGLVKCDKGVVVLVMVVGYLIMIGIIVVFILFFLFEMKSIDMGVIGVFVMGLIIVKFYNKYYNI